MITSCIVACHILECSEGLAQEVISTIGQAFELRFKQYLKNPPKLVTPHDRWERLCACSNKYCKHLHLCQCVYTSVCTLFNYGTSLGSLETPLISCMSVYSMCLLSVLKHNDIVYLHCVLTSYTEKHLITEYFLPYFQLKYLKIWQIIQIYVYILHTIYENKYQCRFSATELLFLIKAKIIKRFFLTEISLR